MVNFRIITRAISIALIAEGFFMLSCSAVSFILKESVAGSLLLSSIITLVSGILVFSPLRYEEKLSGYKEGYIIIAGIWLSLSLLGTLPWMLSGTTESFTDAFFESMSGFTTTGASILTDPGILPKGLVLWRSLSQWIGGLGFILISLSVLPVVKSINIQLTISDFAAQASGRIHPRTGETFKMLISVYVILTLAETVMLIAGGLNIFDALCISFSTLSTGGFSPFRDSLAGTGSPYILGVITIFMFLAGTNLSLIYFAYKRDFRKISSGNEFRLYVILCLVFILTVFLGLRVKNIYPAGKSLILGAFQAVSTISTTGFYHADYNLWGGFLTLIIFFLMFTGGTSGSAGGSLKIIRILVAGINAGNEMKRLVHPEALVPVRVDGKVIPGGLVYNLLVFIILYLMVVCVSAFAVSLMGYDLVTAFSTSAAMLGNIGPAPGTFGPGSTYSALPAGGKWFFSFIMLLGRLEILSVLVLFTGNFYKK